MQSITQNYFKKFTLMCDECKSLSEQSVSMFFDNVELAPDFHLELSDEYYCKTCGKITFQYDIDTNIAKAVRLLNLHGFKTKFSCQGHNKKFYPSTPYIRFDDFGGLCFYFLIRKGTPDFIKCPEEEDEFGFGHVKNSEKSQREKMLEKYGWKFCCPGVTSQDSMSSSDNYDLIFLTDDNETRNLDEVYAEACENLYNVLLEILIDHDQIGEK